VQREELQKRANKALETLESSWCGAQKWEFNLAFQSLKSLYQRRQEAIDLPALPKLDIAEYVKTAGNQLTSMLTQAELQAFSTETSIFAPILARKTSFFDNIQEEFGENYKETVNLSIKSLITEIRRQTLHYSQSLLTPIQEMQLEIATLRSDSKSQALNTARNALFRVKIEDQSGLIAGLIRQAEELKPVMPRSEWQGSIESWYRKVEAKADLALQRAQKVQILKARIEKLTNKETEITDNSWISLAAGLQKSSALPTPEPFQTQPSPPYLQYPQSPFQPMQSSKSTAFAPAVLGSPFLSHSNMQTSDLKAAFPLLPKPSSPPHKDPHSPTLSPVESAPSSRAEFEDSDFYLPNS